MKTSEQINEIAAALAKAQGAIVNPGKDSENPAFKTGGRVSKYAGLADALVIIRKELSGVGVAILQAPRIEGDAQVLDTRLVHTSGQWVGCEWPIGRLGMKQQELGSATTYARRYSLFSLVGIAGADDDDDGNAASLQHGLLAKSAEPGKKIGKTEMDLIRSALLALGGDVEEKDILNYVGVTRLVDIPADWFSSVEKRLTASLAKRREAFS